VAREDANRDGELTGGGVATIKPISPITVDGGTRFVGALDFKPCARMAEIFALLRKDDSPTKDVAVSLPMPQLELHEAAPVAQASVSGIGRRSIVFYVEDEVHATINVERKTIHLQLKAKSLWAAGAGAQGYETMARKWLPAFHYMLTGEHVALEGVQDKGWRMTGLELCTDFQGLVFNREDAPRFIGSHGNGTKDSGRREDLEVYGGQDERAQTIYVGKRTTAPISLALYNKSGQINRAKGGDGSTYWPIWRARGWTEGAEGAEVTRVEFRFTGKGLSHTNGETGEVIDLRDPMTATDPEVLRSLWATTAHKRRLTLPSTSTRKDRCKLDPRWEVVHGVSQLELEFGREWKQSREVQKATHLERQAKADRDLVHAAGRCAVFRGLDTRTMTAVEHRDLVRDALEGARDVDFVAYTEHYKRTRTGFIAQEIEAEKPRYFERVRKRNEARPTQEAA
jgi:hypothetical protein